MVQIDTDSGVILEADTVLDALEQADIFSVSKQQDGRFLFSEECDEYFTALLTRDQLYQLISELKALADS